MKNALRFALAATLYSPKLALEDILRHLTVHVPAKGLNYNDAGQSLMEVWNEAGVETKLKQGMKTKLLVAAVKDLRGPKSEVGKVMRELGLNPDDSPVFLSHFAPVLTH